MNQAIQLNNLATNLIQDEKLSEAIQNLGNAFRQVMMTKRRNQGKGLSSSSSSSSSSMQDVLKLQQQCPTQDKHTREEKEKCRLARTDSKTATHHAEKDDETEDPTAFIYRTPIRIVTSNASYSDVCILFNLALAHHLQALACTKEDDINNNDNDRKRKEILRNALKLYELGYCLMVHRTHEREGGGTPGSHGNFDHEDDELLLDGTLTLSQTMGMVNNCAQIHKEFGRIQKANRLFQHLLSSLILAVECKFLDGGKDDDDDDNTQELEEWERFFGTTSHLILQSTSMARAA
jgi:tetratricopeptide (TPR) repeat protein